MKNQNLHCGILFVLLFCFPAILSSQGITNTNFISNNNLSILTNTINTTDYDFYTNFTSARRDLNRVRPEILSRFFRTINISEDKALKIVNYRMMHGGLAGFGTLAELGFLPEEIEMLTKYFYLDLIHPSSLKLAPEENTDYEEILSKADLLSDYLLYPLDWNSDSAKFLEELPGITPEFAQKIVNYRKTNEIESLAELTNLDIPLENLYSASPYAVIKPTGDRGFAMNIRSGASFSGSNSFLPPYYTFRAEASAQDFRAAWATAAATNHPILAQNIDTLKNSGGFVEWKPLFFDIIGGDYRLAFGQNLLFGPLFVPPVSGVADDPIVQNDRGLKPYAGTHSPGSTPDFYRGISAGMNIESLPLLGWNVGPTLTGFYSEVSTNSGFAVNSKDYGMNAAFNLPVPNFRIGGTYSGQEDDKSTKFNSSLYFDSKILSIVRFFGETAFSDGLGSVNGIIFQNGGLKASVLGYYAQTNYDAPHGSGFLHSSRDTEGIFTGVSWHSGWFHSQIYGDFYTKSTNSLWKQKYEEKLEGDFKFKEPGLKELYTKIQSRYSDLIDTRNIRSDFNLTAYFAGTWNIGFSWQNLVEFNRKEYGNSYTFKAGAKPWKAFSWVYRLQYYKAASYQSALFSPEEPAYFGDSSIRSYYGTGTEQTLVLRLEAGDDLSFSAKYREENRIIPASFKKELSVQGEWRM